VFKTTTFCHLIWGQLYHFLLSASGPKKTQQKPHDSAIKPQLHPRQLR